MKFSKNYKITSIYLGTTNVGIHKPKHKSYIYSENDYLSHDKLPETPKNPQNDIDDETYWVMYQAWASEHFIVFKHVHINSVFVIERYNDFFVKKVFSFKNFSRIYDIFFTGETFFVVTEKFIAKIQKKSTNITYIYNFNKNKFKLHQEDLDVNIKKRKKTLTRDLNDVWFDSLRIYLLYGDIIVIFNILTEEVENILVFTEFLEKVFVFNDNIYVKKAYSWTLCKLNMFTFEYLDLIDINMHRIRKIFVNHGKCVFVGFELVGFMDSLDNTKIIKIDRNMEFTHVTFNNNIFAYDMKYCEALILGEKCMNVVNYLENNRLDMLRLVLVNGEEVIEIYADKIVINNYKSMEYEGFSAKKDELFYKLNQNEELYKKEMEKDREIPFSTVHFTNAKKIDKVFLQTQNEMEIQTASKAVYADKNKSSIICSFEKEDNTVTIMTEIIELTSAPEFFNEINMLNLDNNQGPFDQIRSNVNDLQNFKKLYVEKNKEVEYGVDFPVYDYIVSEYEKDKNKKK